MEPMMMKAILGRRAGDCDDASRARLTATVRGFIDRTTGLQTLAQMKGLVGLIRETGLVVPADVLDEHGYKAIFNEDIAANHAMDHPIFESVGSEGCRIGPIGPVTF